MWIFLLTCPPSALTSLMSKPLPGSATSLPGTQFTSIPQSSTRLQIPAYTPVSPNPFHIQITNIILVSPPILMCPGSPEKWS